MKIKFVILTCVAVAAASVFVTLGIANPMAPPTPEWIDGELVLTWAPAPGVPIAHRLYSSESGSPWELVTEVPRNAGATADTFQVERVPGFWSWYVSGVFIEAAGDSTWTFEGPPSPVSQLSVIPVVGPPGVPGRIRWDH